MQGAWDGTIPPDYYAYAQGRESGGDDNARNDKSSATGRYQFIDGTWQQLMQQHPDLGLTPDGRTDPAQSTRAMQAFTQDNAQSLASAGAPVNTHSLYLAHRFGVGGALKVLGADPSAPVGSVLPNVITANPDLRGKTVADIIGGKAMAYASPDNSNGALSTNANIGGGILAPGNGQAGSAGGLENGLYGAAAALAGIYSPAQAAQLNSMKTAQSGGYSISTLPDGTMVRINNKNGQVEKLPGNYAKDERKFGVIGVDKYGNKQYGWSPTEEAYDAAHPPGAAAPADEGPDVSTLSGPDFLDQLTKDKGAQYANSVQAIVDGRALMPHAGSRAPGAQQLRADALQADPTLQEGTGPARVKLRQSYETATGPNSPAVQIRMGNTALDHGGNLSDEIEAMKSYNDHADSAIPGVSYGLNALHNKTLAGQSSPEAQAYRALQSHIENFASEKAKYLGGGVAGEHEKQRILDLYDLNKSLPELRAGMAADAEDVMAKGRELQNGWRNGNDNSSLVKDFPVISKEGQAGYDRIIARHSKTKAGGYVPPGSTAPSAAPTGNRPSLDSIFK